MNGNRNDIVDERQESQSIKNGNLTSSVVIMMLCVFFVAQTLFQQRSFAYTGPEFITLMTACVMRIVLDVRHGVVYTKMNAKKKLTAALYISAAMIFAVVLGVRNYTLYGFELWMIVLVIVPTFLVVLTLFLITHFTVMKLSKNRLKKMERRLDEESE